MKLAQQDMETLRTMDRKLCSREFEHGTNERTVRTQRRCRLKYYHNLQSKFVHGPKFKFGGTVRRNYVRRKNAVACSCGLPPDSSPPSKQGNKNKSWLNFLLVSLFTVSGFVFAPSLISTKAGVSILCKAVSSVIPGRVSIKNVQFVWTKPIMLSHLSIFPHASQVPALQVDSVSTSSTLWQIISRRKVQDLAVSGLEIDATTRSRGIPCVLTAFLKAKEPVCSVSDRPVVNSKIVSVEVKGTDAGIVLEDSRLILDETASALFGDTVSIIISGVHQANGFENWQPRRTSTGHLMEAPEMYRCQVISEVMNLDCVFSQHNGAYRIVEKVHAKLKPSTTLPSMYLGRISPLLSDIISLRSGTLEMAVWPESGWVDSDSWRFELEPLDAELEGGGITNSILQFLEGFRAVHDKSNVIRTQAKYSCKFAKLRGYIRRNGEVFLHESELICGWKAGNLRLVFGGKTYTAGDTVFLDSTIGIPKDELENFLKLRNLPAGYILRLHLGGSQDKPDIDWRSPAEEVLNLFARQVIGTGSQALAQRVHSILQGSSKRGYSS